MRKGGWWVGGGRVGGFFFSSICHARILQHAPPAPLPVPPQVLPVVAGTRVSITYDVFRRESSASLLPVSMPTEAALTAAPPPAVGANSTPPFLASGFVEAAGLLASASLAQAGKRSRSAWEGGDGDSSAAAASAAPAAVADAPAAVTAAPAAPTAAAADAGSTPPASAQAVSSGTVSAALAAAFADPRLLPFGGSLIYHCTHRYPHTAAELAGGSERLLATALKGVDAVVLTAARACGASLTLVPLLLLMNRWNEPGEGVSSAAEAVALLRRTEDDVEEDEDDEEEEDEEEYIMKKSLRGVTDPARFAAALADSERRAEEAARRAATDAGVAAGVPHTVAGVARGAAPAAHRGATQRACSHELLALRTLRAAGVEFGSNRAFGMLSDLSPPLCGAACCEDDFSVLSKYGPVVDQLPASTCLMLAPRPLVELNDLPTDRARLALQGMGMVQGNDAGHPDFLYSVLALVIAVPSADDLQRGGDGTGPIDVEVSDQLRRGDDDTSVIYVESSDSEGSVTGQCHQAPAPAVIALASSASRLQTAQLPAAAEPAFDGDDIDEAFDSESDADPLAAPPTLTEQRVVPVPTGTVPPESPPRDEVRSSCQCQ